ncbi:hypothetical protein halTADL_1589 [Halohasta litchfieldiae]|jgi:hypothetical protein|uniref:Uncharacterized protein n=1 Tax=Halohasta litchfieldiae TaxID=1073996 RepID=A0A1H6XK59_9EURY|nr:hypothetical protein [Halohasta litchfieldiae]ATW88345.1 hypothetical protein halTADL_1589 [Halohasta litchfieldiae]SEJ25272.1 hypothetical protein SAMN05444271_1362 [Halohasta litchfieldiae]
MDDQFRTRSCFVGIGATGAERIGDGIERRDASATMVPDEVPDPADAVVDCTGSVTDDQFSEFDVVVTTGSAAVDDAVDTVVRVGDACASDAVTIAVVNGDPTATDLARLEGAFGTVVPLEQEGKIREHATDVFTLFSQPMMLHADYAHINSNLREAGVITLSRAVRTREELAALVDDCGGPEEVVLGYVEAGSEFTLADAETLEAQFETPEIVTGQTTFDDPSKCRLTLLRRM